MTKIYQLITLIMSSLLINQVQSLYFYLEEGSMKCFKDELVKSSVTYISLINK